MEAAEAGIAFIACITEGVPAHDEAWFYNKLRRDFPDTRLLGPNCPGIISPGKCNIGITAGHIAKEGGPVGHREPVGDAHVPGAVRAQAEGRRRHHVRGHRRRPGAGHQLHRLPARVRGRSRDQGRDDDRRDRWFGRRGGRRLREGAHDQAGRRLRGRRHRAPGQEDGPRRAPSSRAARAPPRRRSRRCAKPVRRSGSTPPRPASSWRRSSPSSSRAASRDSVARELRWARKFAQ